jgi:transcriptional regulator with XRE-family HTH domain
MKKLNIRKLREARGWTRQQMAEHFGVNLTTVLRWENNGIPTRGSAKRAIEIEFSEKPVPASHEAA